MEPYLRLVHAIVEDEEVVEAYRKINTWEDREMTDARNSDARPLKFEELCAKVYNDPGFNPVTASFPDLHDDFRSSIVLSANVSPTVTADKIKDKLANCRAKLLRLIADWEKSGNGSGQRAETEPDYGHVSDDQQFVSIDNQGQGDTEDVADEDFVDGDKRKNFLRDYKPYLIYMWQVFDDNDLLYHTLSRLPSQFRADSQGVPRTIVPGPRSEAGEREKEAENTAPASDGSNGRIASAIEAMVSAMAAGSASDRLSREESERRSRKAERLSREETTEKKIQQKRQLVLQYKKQ